MASEFKKVMLIDDNEIDLKINSTARNQVVNLFLFSYPLKFF